jgi:hypothetical protein
LLNRELEPQGSLSLAPRPSDTFSSLAGAVITSAVDKLGPGQSLTAGVMVLDDDARSLTVEVEVHDDRGETCYAVAVTLGP